MFDGDKRPNVAKKNNLTRAKLAKMLKYSQSRIAKMEKGDPTVYAMSPRPLRLSTL
jgi:transcriptional regulator with XRE-family HTH domain